MRLWAQQLIPYLDRQRLLSQHRECAALRGKGWGKKHATVDYVFTHDPEDLVVYHWIVMEEMRKRGYHPDPIWEEADWRGSDLGKIDGWCDIRDCTDIWMDVNQMGQTIYPEHNDDYLRECINLLKEKQAPIDWSVVEQKLDIN